MTPSKNAKVQVYIASTQGLVEIQSISALPNVNLRSVVSVNFSAQLAGISQDYANFVSMPQGIIQSHFGKAEYRLNLSANIDQGDSWQLGVYVAHLLHQSGYFFSAAKMQTHPELKSLVSDVKQEIGSLQTEVNLVLIATGAVNTESESVVSIQHLAKKCETANNQIQKWQGEGKKVVFLVPSANYKEPIPDTLISLCPVQHLNQLPSLLVTLFDLPLYSETEINAALLPDASPSDKSKSRKEHSTGYEEALIIDAEEREAESIIDSINKFLGSYRILALLFIILFGSFLYLSVFDSTHKNDLSLQGLEYRLSAVLSENKSACRLAIELAQSEQSQNPAENKYLAAINGGDYRGVSELRHFNDTPTSSLSNLCQLTLHSSNQIKGMWMLSQSTGLVSVLPVIMPNKNRQWSIPLPQNTVHLMQYHLLLFTESPDAADFQSLQSFIARNKDSDDLASAEDLSQWSRQLGLPVMFLSHRLR